MEAWKRNLTSTLVLSYLFLLFFPLSQWPLLAAFIIVNGVLDSINQKRNLHTLVILGVLLIISAGLFYPNIVMILCMCLCSFILQTLNMEPGKKLIMASGLLGIHLLKSPSLGLLIVLMTLFLSHLLITIMMTSRNQVQLSQRLKVIAALGIGGTLLAGIIPYLTYGIRNLLSIAVFGLTSLLSEGLYKGFSLFEPDETNPKQQERMTAITSSKGQMETFEYKEYTTPSYFYPILLSILLVIFIGAIVFIVKRRRAIQAELNHHRLSELTKSSRELTKGQRGRRAINSNPPSNMPIRMLVYQFEKGMKGTHGRNPEETFQEWLNRIQLDRNEQNSRLSEIYEKARYGEEEIPKDDVRFFSDRLKQIKKQLKHPKR